MTDEWTRRSNAAAASEPTARAAAVEMGGKATKEQVEANVRYHAAKSTSALPIEFGVPEMYQATAQSVREGLVRPMVTTTYAHFHKKNPEASVLLVHGILARSRVDECDR